ncbi:MULTISPECIES: hypothetical protein [unclassified Streptomyces]|uniref:hypothetical protein n=1 Tax=unclassified Streptomyces TaxID=2593676 RepID=UPI00081EA9BA|nr:MULTISPECIES: hypothetical protein [unclassified Streptomyces]MYZ35474.1 hypothetical protein [Streptomyces sp. SID4917]SCF75762.1 hypothetical protein GA0115259_102127 [Streptomyces sp. MnatMP-M17]
MPGATPRGYPFPLYADVQNFPAAIQSLATAVDADVQLLETARAGALNEPTVRVTNLTAQSIPGSTTTTITWGAAGANYDNASMWNPATPTLLTFTQPGIYLLEGRLEVAASGTATEVGTYTTITTSGAQGPLATAQSLRMAQTSPTRPDLLCLYLAATAGETFGMTFFHDHTTAKSVGARSITATRISTAIGLP